MTTSWPKTDVITLYGRCSNQAKNRRLETALTTQNAVLDVKPQSADLLHSWLSCVTLREFGTL